MYALARNAWKFRTRDHRKTKSRKSSSMLCAPDTADEIFHAMELLETWTAKRSTQAAPRPRATRPAVTRRRSAANCSWQTTIKSANWKS